MGVEAPALTMFPEDYRPTALAEIKKSGILGPEKFRWREEFWWRRAKELLMKPYDSSPPQISVRTPEPHLVFIQRDIYPYTSVVFANYGPPSGWWLVPGNVKIP